VAHHRGAGFDFEIGESAMDEEEKDCHEGEEIPHERLLG
jgi:hypothetical protein